MSCGLFVIIFAWAVISGDESVLHTNNVRGFVCSAIADRGKQLSEVVQV